MKEGGTTLDLCVCIPARNEAARLPALLAALAAQTWPHPFPVAIILNNTADDSRERIERERPGVAGKLILHVHDVTLEPAQAHAGTARRLAMDKGLSLLSAGARGVLVSTDADTRPPPDWLCSIARAIGRGADVVGGRIEIDHREPLPAPVQRLRSAWDRYWQTVRAIEDEIDPVPWDLPPRHGDHTGASLAIRASLYRQCGGVPVIPLGEDRALVAAATACGGRLAHPQDVYTRVSSRQAGTAPGGMASAMQEMFELAARGGLPEAPAFRHWRERAMWRRHLRGKPGGSALVARLEPDLPPMPHDMALEIAP